MRRYARHRGTAIEDVVQQALIVICRRVGNVCDAAALSGWIFRIVARMKMLHDPEMA